MNVAGVGVTDTHAVDRHKTKHQMRKQWQLLRQLHRLATPWDQKQPGVRTPAQLEGQPASEVLPG